MKPRAVILGGNGQLGNYLSKNLERSFEVFSFSKNEIDITVSEVLEQKVKDIRPEDLINCAAYTKVGLAEIEHELANAINHIAVKNLASICSKNNTHLLHFSTDYVFPGNKNQPYIEEDPTQPIGVYGLSKLKGEISLKNSDCKFTILRISGVYSERGDSFLGKIVSQLKISNETIKVVNDQFTMPTSVKFISDRIIDLSNANAFANYEGEVIHIAPDGEISWYDFAAEIKRAYEKKTGFKTQEIEPISSDELNLIPPRPKNSVLSNEKLKKILKKKFFPSCIEVLRQYYS